MKVVVTGASGFVGSALIRELVSRDHEVIALARSGGIPKEAGQAVRWVRGALDINSAEEVLRFSPDACIHSAWVAKPGIYLESPENDTLVGSSFDFLHSLVNGGVKQISAIGTCAEYDITNELPLKEDNVSSKPASRYARAKVELHDLLRSRIGELVPICWARVFFPYGKGEHPNRLPSWLIRQMLDGHFPELRTPADVNDYIHISDTVRALAIATECSFEGPLNIGTGKGVQISDILNLIAVQLNREDLLAPPKRSDSGKTIIADSSTLRSLGWSDEVSLDEGIRDLIESLAPKSSGRILNT